MPKDLVAEKKHRKEVRRKKVRLFERLKGDGSGKYRHGPMGNESLPPHASPPPSGPKKFKWKRDVLNKDKA